ncbi:MAG TPA: adenylate cyclase regulatory domain-containing protein [Candidatus Dormibacteraeota bacterium]|nr:adenylate cyclase regulatory domain-containing protein [Candidatus Dormibacteraeota bacterium]
MTAPGDGDDTEASPPRRRARLAPGDPLLAGAETEAERRARRRLIRELLDEGVEREDLLDAVESDRLSLLLTDLILRGGRQYSDETLERRTGLSRAQLDEFRRAAGLSPVSELTNADLTAASALARLLEAGIPADDIVDVCRVAGQGVSSIARAITRVAARVLVRAGDSELDVSRRYVRAADEFFPLVTALGIYQFRGHLREALRQEAVGRVERETGGVRGARDICVAFADLVGFTRLGNRVHADEIGRVAGRLVTLAYELAGPQVAIVKTIGDAVMFVSPEAGPLVDCLLRLVAAVDAEGEDFPQLRAGVASGPAVEVGADWYGHAVNLASRLTAAARPGYVVATAEVREATGDEFRWSRALPRHLRGVRGPVLVARVRAHPAPGERPRGLLEAAVQALTFPTDAAPAAEDGVPGR